MFPAISWISNRHPLPTFSSRCFLPFPGYLTDISLQHFPPYVSCHFLDIYQTSTSNIFLQMFSAISWISNISQNSESMGNKEIFCLSIQACIYRILCIVYAFIHSIYCVYRRPKTKASPDLILTLQAFASLFWFQCPINMQKVFFLQKFQNCQNSSNKQEKNLQKLPNFS